LQLSLEQLLANKIKVDDGCKRVGTMNRVKSRVLREERERKREKCDMLYATHHLNLVSLKTFFFISLIIFFLSSPLGVEKHNL